MAGAKPEVSRGEHSPARSATHLARKKRVRWAAPASRALKKTKRRTPARSAACSRRTGARPLSSSGRGRGLVADRRRQVDDGVDAAQGLAHGVGIGEVAEIAERDLHVDPSRAELARVGAQAA